MHEVTINSSACYAFTYYDGAGGGGSAGGAGGGGGGGECGWRPLRKEQLVMQHFCSSKVR